jgi:hypothetical protein
MLSLFAAGVISFGFGLVHAADPMSDKEATPSMKERLTKDAIKGTLMKMEGEEYYWIKDNDGKEMKIHVDKSTKMDKVVVGDKVKACAERSSAISSDQ